jgi:hypothetical protein
MSNTKQIKTLPLYLFFVTILFFTYTGIDAKASNVVHTPVISAVENIDVVITASSSSAQDAVIRGTVYFRQINEQNYLSQPISRSGKVFEGKIPAKYVTGIALEYYVALYLVDGTIITSPENNAQSFPHIIVIVPAEKDWFEILYPEKDSIIENKKPQISASFNTDTVNSKEDIQIRLDDRDVTQKCEITQDFFSYIPSDDLTVGKHVITVTNINKLGMAGSWQFTISGKPDLLQNFTGSASATWQLADSDSKSPFLLYRKGSNVGLLAQLGGQILGQEFDGWLNRNTLYGSRTTDFGFGFYSDKVTINAGDIFPSMSELVLDSFPARGAEVFIKPFERLNLQIVGAESRLFTGSDKFIADLVNSKFGAFRFAVYPIKEKWEINASYVYAKNHTDSTSDTPFSMDKKNNVMSVGTQFKLPAQISLHAEWARSRHITDYGEEFGSDSHLDQALSAGMSKQIGKLSFETSYVNIGNEFLSEANPFLESGRKGMEFLFKYPYKYLSLQAEYDRYYRKGNIDTEIKANINLSLSNFLLFTNYYQQRVPYAKYNLRGASLGSSYKFWNLNLSSNSSWSISNFWINNIDRNSIFSSVRIEYDMTSDMELVAEYTHFMNYKSKNVSSIQRQASLEAQKYITKKHLLSIAFKVIKLKEKENTKNGYFEKVLLIKYQYFI